MPESFDKTGRLVLDHVADITDTSREKRHAAHRAFTALTRAGWQHSVWSIDAAVRTGNHRLLRWLMESGGPYFHRESPHLDLEEMTWVTVHSRNLFALRYCEFTAEHYEHVALEDDTELLGRMRQVGDPTPGPVPITRFIPLLSGETRDGYLGFRWLLRRGMIDLDELNPYHHNQIVALYGNRVSLLFSP